MQIVQEPPLRRYIEFRVGRPDVSVDGKLSNSTEAYQLIAEGRAEKVTIVSPSSAGAFYAYQTIKSLMSSDASLPSITVKDAPRYVHRGLHLDVGRNFQSKSAILKVLDAMAMYKLNKLHLHLAEDEGWRLEIPGLEELTKVTAWENVHRCILNCSKISKEHCSKTSKVYKTMNILFDEYIK